MTTPATPSLQVACLCAAWCRTCDDYAPVFEQVLATLRATYPQLQAHWIDIEDEAELVGDFDVETFPTLVVVDDRAVRFAGPLTPQPETLQRILRVALAASAEGAPAAPQPPEMEAFAQRLRQRLR
jgi:thioredoxin-like negative regulator of GroEL